MKDQIQAFRIVVGVAAFLACSTFASDQRIANTVTETSKFKLVRATQIYDVQCRLIVNKDNWQTSETPKFKAYIPGRGNDNLWLATVIDQRFQIQVDGQWYRYTGPEWIGGLGSHCQTQWMVEVGGYLPVSLDKDHWKAVKNLQALPLTPGEHKISLGWAGYKSDPSSQSGHEEDENPVLLVSESVWIRILKTPATAEQVSMGNEWRRQVTELFNAYVQIKPFTKAEQKLGLKTNLRSFHGWRPKFTWEDIPALLEIACKDRLIEDMPKLVISSYIGKRCREGMIALWLIEGLRREQISLQREKQLGKKSQLHIAYSRLPLNPICTKKNMAIGQCEQSLKIHKAVLRAYRSWWQTVGSLPAYQAAAFYPLDRTNLRWYGAPDRWLEEPLKIHETIASDRTVAIRTIRQLQRIEGREDYEPGKILQTVYYGLRNPDVKAPFTSDMLKIQRVVLYYYDKQGHVDRAEDILLPLRQSQE